MRLSQFILAAAFSAATVLPVMAQTAATTTAPTTTTAPAATTKAAPAPAATATAPATPAPAVTKTAKPATAAAVTGPISINTATSEQLDTLPGIGKVRAGKIIANRPYKALDELVSKKAVGPKEFDKIKDKITL